MVEIRLPRSAWDYDPDQPLGPEGGFGAVFAGRAADHSPVAVKMLKVTPNQGGHRELRIADELAGRPFKHVIPVYDCGQDAASGHFFVVMARAERSLQSVLDDGRTFREAEAAGVLLDVLDGLEEVADLVHRDLKPGNILYHEGAWKVADFGIARFIEASTSRHTLKGFLSPAYAAPEQWRYETASPATDLYALGCIAYALFTGRPPFAGPGDDAIKDAHLHASPPPLPGVSPTTASLCAMLLSKIPGSRPDRARVRSVLQRAADGVSPPATGGLAQLAQAGAAAAQAAAAAEAEQERARGQRAGRAALAAEGRRTLDGSIDSLWAAISQAAPGAVRRNAHTVELGGAQLSFDLGLARSPIAQGAFPLWGWDVVAGATVAVCQAAPRYVWSASLWYASPPTTGAYRWWEVSYCANALCRTHPEFEPFALPPCEDADIACSRTMTHTVAVAFGPRPADGEDFAQFADRWADLLARAASGRLGRPPRLPLE